MFYRKRDTRPPLALTWIVDRNLQQKLSKSFGESWKRTQACSPFLPFSSFFFATFLLALLRFYFLPKKDLKIESPLFCVLLDFGIS